MTVKFMFSLSSLIHVVAQILFSSLDLERSSYPKPTRDGCDKGASRVPADSYCSFEGKFNALLFR